MHDVPLSRRCLSFEQKRNRGPALDVNSVKCLINGTSTHEGMLSTCLVVQDFSQGAACPSQVVTESAHPRIDRICIWSPFWTHRDDIVSC